jgi:hypothetical protein
MEDYPEVLRFSRQLNRAVKTFAQLRPVVSILVIVSPTDLAFDMSENSNIVTARLHFTTRLGSKTPAVPSGYHQQAPTATA